MAFSNPVFFLRERKGRRKSTKFQAFTAKGLTVGPPGLRCLHLQGRKVKPGKQEASSIATLRMEEDLLIPMH